MEGAQVLNDHLRKNVPSQTLIDFAGLAQRYQKLQSVRGEQQRNLQESQGTLGHLGQMLLARYTVGILKATTPHFDWTPSIL